MALSIIGTPGAAQATSITMPTHAAGDILVIYAYRSGSTTVPSKPSAGGHVPTWNDIDAPTGSDSGSGRTAYTVATESAHTSGTWTNASCLSVIVIRGQDTNNPIGGHTTAGGNGLAAIAPAVTLTDTTGASILLHFYGATCVYSWAAAPSGYTNKASANSQYGTGVRLNTKNSTTSDGTSSNGDLYTPISGNYYCAAVEILNVQPVDYDADASLEVTASPTGVTKWDATSSAIALAVTATPTGAASREQGLDATALAVTATPAGAAKWDATSVATALAVTATSTGAAKWDATSIATALAVTATSTGAATRETVADAISLVVAATPVGVIQWDATSLSSLEITVSPEVAADVAAGYVDYFADASLEITATLAGVTSRNQSIDTDLVVTASPVGTASWSRRTQDVFVNQLNRFYPQFSPDILPSRIDGGRP